MALILGVHRGSRIYLDDTPMDVLDHEGHGQVLVECGGKQFQITAQEAQEVFPRVFVSAGLPKAIKHDTLPRLVIEAPRDIVILRQELYEQGQYK